MVESLCHQANHGRGGRVSQGRHEGGSFYQGPEVTGAGRRGGGGEEGDETARICLQILHAGQYAAHAFAISSSATKSPIYPFRARGLLFSGVEGEVSDFVRCDVLARSAVYGGVDIMGSEGYLINKFLACCNNQRDN